MGLALPIRTQISLPKGWEGWSLMSTTYTNLSRLPTNPGKTKKNKRQEVPHLGSFARRLSRACLFLFHVQHVLSLRRSLRMPANPY